MTENRNNEHRCDTLPTNGVNVYRTIQPQLRNKEVWMLYVTREATVEDLEDNHYLNTVGDIIWQTIIEISHCPYCGMRLIGKSHGNLENYGKFLHADHTRLNTRTHDA